MNLVGQATDVLGCFRHVAYNARMPIMPARPSIVYMATNKITGGRYIGYTSRSLKRRRSYHIKGATNGYGPGLFAKAIREYGADAFEWKTIARRPTADKALAEEQRLIRKLQPEYNRTKGGGAYKPLVHSDEVVEQLRQLGRKRIKTWRQYSHLGPAASAKRVVCLDDGRLFPSAQEAARTYKVCPSSVIELCNRHSRRLTVGGRVFRYFGDHTGGVEEARRIHSGPGRRSGGNPHKGVHRHVTKEHGVRFRARVWTGFGRGGRKAHCLGIFNTVEEAQIAYQLAKLAIETGTFRP